MAISTDYLTTTLPIDSSIEEFLEFFDAYILVLVKKSLATLHTYKQIHPATASLDRDEVVQRVRINIWRALQKQEIINPKAYIRRIVYHETVNLLRQRRHVGRFFFEEDEEIYQGKILIELGEGMGDPAFEVEQRETTHAYHVQAARAMTTLGPQQQKAMLCSLKDHLDNFTAFAEACKDLGINTEQSDWPYEQQEKKRLQANISSARKNMYARSKTVLVET